jgi:hypothetical protein
MLERLILKEAREPDRDHDSQLPSSLKVHSWNKEEREKTDVF